MRRIEEGQESRKRPVCPRRSGPFFAGELVGHKRMMGCAVVHKGQRVVGVGWAVFP